MTQDDEGRWFKVGDTIPKGWTIVAYVGGYVIEHAHEVFAVPPRPMMVYPATSNDPPAPR